MNFDGIKDIMNRCIDNHEENGAAFVLSRNGEHIADYACGVADAENNIKMSGDTICRAFSCSKVATAVCCMMLVERGLLDIEWNLDWIIPEFANPVYIRDGKEISSKPIKIRDLLNMTSGIAYPGDNNEGIDKMNNLWGELDNRTKSDNPMTTVEFAKKAGACPLMFEAGHEWMYGSSADILGAVVEVISGIRFSEFMRRNLLNPLDMNDTDFYVPPQKADRLAMLYENSGENLKKCGYVNLCIYDFDKLPAFESGGAGLFSTANDYAKLGAMLANGGVYHGRRILGSKTVEFMTENALTDEQKKSFSWDSTKGYGYANLVRMVENRNTAGTFASRGAFGWDGWTGTYLLCDPKENVAVTVFVQRCGAGTTQLSRNVVNGVYSLLDEE